ncbi:ABC transporter ATP-binding protein [Streptomyces platensis]|uniref:ABC transporter ATP-binding protein n=1 Tax=Streptomyces platensis TaxID=58346 RepID=UPI0036C67263
MVEASGLSCTFRGKRVVDDVSLTLRAGSVTGFVGSNGAGKTTTLRLMLGLLRGEGATTFQGRPLTQWPAPARVVGAVFGGVAGHPKHRIRDHLRMVAAGAGASNARVDELLETVGMTGAAKMRISQLSLGMAQRVGIAQAVIGSPRVLVLDEPSNGLDPHAIRWLRGFLRDLAADGVAVLVSSHLLAEMERQARRSGDQGWRPAGGYRRAGGGDQRSESGSGGRYGGDERYRAVQAGRAEPFP